MAECMRLESARRATVRGFESHTLRRRPASTAPGAIPYGRGTAANGDSANQPGTWRRTAQRLDPERAGALDEDLDDLARRNDRGTGSLVMDWEYLLLTARKRS